MHKSRKTNLFEELKGKILEVGPGTGVNFPFMNGDNIHWIGCEPNPAMHPYLYDTAKKNSVEAKLINCTTEAISIADNSVDYVISSEVLCSVNNLNKSLSEIRRVLKPKGKFLFLEHVVDKHNIWRRAIQKFVPYTPWKYFSDGCYPARDIGKAIQDTGFSTVHFEDYMQDGAGIIISINRPHIYGWAIK
jgi:ubiquinone/menaquinone biosynthesis C-methylase UbiE